jgi:hypothetical protein
LTLVILSALYENRKFTNNVDWLLCHVFPLVPKLQLGNALPGKLQLPLLMGIEAGASAQLCSQAGAWEQEAKDLHPIHNIFMLRCDPHGVMGVNVSTLERYQTGNAALTLIAVK